MCYLIVLSNSQLIQQHILSLPEGGRHRCSAGYGAHPHHERCSPGGSWHYIPAHACRPHQVPVQRGGGGGEKQGCDDCNLPLPQPWSHLDDRHGTCGRNRCVCGESRFRLHIINRLGQRWTHRLLCGCLCWLFAAVWSTFFCEKNVFHIVFREEADEEPLIFF